MASTAAKAALGIVAAAATYLIVADITESTPAPKRKKAPSIPDGPTGDPNSRVEPEESWAARWETRADDAIVKCRTSKDVNTYSQAVVCMLTEAFPEAAPWTGDATSWPDWMFKAREQVKEDLHTLVMDEVGSYGANGWQFQVWLTYDRFIPRCRSLSKDPDKVVECLVRKMYPSKDLSWSSELEGWQADLWGHLRNRIGVS